MGKSFGLLYMGLRSTAGYTIILTIVAMVLATIDQGYYIIVNTFITGGMWALMAMGLALVFGVMNIPNFAHGEFFMIGGLVGYYVQTALNHYVTIDPNPLLAEFAPLVTFFTAMVAGFLAGILLELFVFRPLRKRSREEWIMNSFTLTLGISVIMVNSHQLIFGANFKGIVKYWNVPSVSIFNCYVSFDRLFVFFLTCLVMVAFWMFMKFSRPGRAIRAVSQDETGASMVGINLNSIQTLTMAVSCGLAALAGSCLLFIFPSYPTVGFMPLYNSFFAIIVAGLGNVVGAAIGGFIIAFFQVITSVYIGEGWGFVIPSCLIILVLIFRPSGIFGSVVEGKHS
jgi:branched-chain amino acid transport system permease protein